MPSLRANLAFYAVQYKFSHRKHATPQQILDDVRDTWRQENAPEVVPTSDEEVFAGVQVFHVRPRGERVETGKVVVYWHGGEYDEWSRSDVRSEERCGSDQNRAFRMGGRRNGGVEDEAMRPRWCLHQTNLLEMCL